MPNTQRHTMITAHAGAEGTQANTLQSLKLLCACGADAVEMDVRAAEDGTLLLSHNPLEACAEYATLRDALNLVHDMNDTLMVNIDLKEESLTQRVWAVAERCGMAGRLLFTGSVCPVDERFVEGIPADIWYNEFLLQPDERDNPLESVLRRGHPAINIHYPRVDLDALTPDTARRYSCWTLDNEEALAAFLRAGVLNITTRIPKRALEMRKEIQGE